MVAREKTGTGEAPPPHRNNGKNQFFCCDTHFFFFFFWCLPAFRGMATEKWNLHPEIFHVTVHSIICDTFIKGLKETEQQVYVLFSPASCSKLNNGHFPINYSAADNNPCRKCQWKLACTFNNLNTVSHTENLGKRRLSFLDKLFE